MDFNWLHSVAPEFASGLPVSMGTLAWAVLIAGILLWLFGVAIARLAAAAALGTLLGALGLLLAMNVQSAIPPFAAGVVGFIAGAIAGFTCFKAMQGFTLAALLSMAAAGIFWLFQVPHAQLAPETSSGAPRNIPGPLQHLWMRIAALSPADQQHLLLAAGSAALVAILLAILFPRITTATLSAIVGGGLILAAANLFMLTNQPGTVAGILPANPEAWGAMLAILAAVGITVQYRWFIRRRVIVTQAVAPAAA